MAHYQRWQVSSVYIDASLILVFLFAVKSMSSQYFLGCHPGGCTCQRVWVLCR